MITREGIVERTEILMAMRKKMAWIYEDLKNLGSAEDILEASYAIRHAITSIDRGIDRGGPLRLIGKDGKRIKVGSYVRYCDKKCYVYQIKYDDIGLECCRSGVSWGCIQAQDIGATWKVKR